MIVYSATKKSFIEDVKSNRIDEIIENEVMRKLNRNSPRNEKLSWKNSLRFMSQILWDETIPNSAGIAIEYNLPMTNRRVDFILTGKNIKHEDTAIIIELKQWEEVKKTSKDAIVKTRFQWGETETNHPSYQAWSYSSLIEDYNETVRKESIHLIPCTYLHNMKSSEIICDPFYKEHILRAPVFIESDALKLSNFLIKNVKYGDDANILYRIENGVIKPSKNLADSLASMLNGNNEFLMIDEQKLIYETALDLAHKSQTGVKQTLIVRGGPGTGKSVIAINLLSELTNRGILVQYVSKNAAPREVFKKKLSATKKKTHIDQMFKGSGSYVQTDNDVFGALLVDEAHRLNEKSGLYSNLGENQIKELIDSSRFTVFFIDEAQRVTLKDIGSVEEIRYWANKLNSNVTELDLVSQFRCNGSDGYLAWIDNSLQIRETANPTLDDIDYEVLVFDDPNKLRNEIFKKNQLTNKARMVAGYCWDWVSKKDDSKYDITIPEFNFKAQWNLSIDGSLWIVSEKSVKEIGCIHTCQGLELDYVGVIIGDDFIIRDGVAITDANKRSSNDRSIRGFKTMLKSDPTKANELTSEIIKNTYRTLMTRGQKGCYIFCTDLETREYFKSILKSDSSTNSVINPFCGLNFPIVPYSESKPFINHVPIITESNLSSLREVENFENNMWVELPSHIKISSEMYVIKMLDESMNKRIPNGSWCLFKKPSKDLSYENKIVLIDHNYINTLIYTDSYCINKIQYNGNLIKLIPETNSFGFSEIILQDVEINKLILGEYLTNI